MASTAYLYTRYSTRHQDDSKLVLAYEAQMMSYFEYKLKPEGVTCAGLFLDKATSGLKPFHTRICGARLEGLMGPGDHIIMVDLDRGFRDVIDCLNTVRSWNARGIKPHILKLGVDPTTAMGQCVLTMMAALAELERGRCSERQIAVQAYMIERGLKRGANCGMGYRWVERGNYKKSLSLLEIDTNVPPKCRQPATVILETILRLRANGMSLLAIQRSLRSAGNFVPYSSIGAAIKFHQNVALRRHAIGIQQAPAIDDQTPVRIVKPSRGMKAKLSREVVTVQGKTFPVGTECTVAGYFGGRYDLLIPSDSTDRRRDRPNYVDGTCLPGLPRDWFECDI